MIVEESWRLSSSRLTASALREITHAFINMNHFPKQAVSAEQAKVVLTAPVLVEYSERMPSCALHVNNIYCNIYVLASMSRVCKQNILLHTPTHSQLSLEQLVHEGVHCLKPDYIAEYLSKVRVTYC